MIKNGLYPPIGVDNSCTREKWVKSMLLNLPPGARILDAGAGTQRYKKYCTHLEYVSQDFGKYDGTGNGKGLQTGKYNYGSLDIVSDIINIPKPNQIYDAILCTEVLEHLPYPEKAIAEFSRLLKSSGILILTAPFCSLTHYAPYHYCSGFNRYWYEYHLQKNGFSQIEYSCNGNFYEFIAQEVNRLPSIARQYSHKKLSILAILTKYILKWTLYRMSMKDKGSAEVLCFGYHVTAIRCK